MPTVREEILNDLENNYGDGLFDILNAKAHTMDASDLFTLARELNYGMYRMSQGDDIIDASRSVASVLRDFGWGEE